MSELFRTSHWDFKIDPKKRVSLPSGYRDPLRQHFDSEQVLLTVTPERCLYGYPASMRSEVLARSKVFVGLGKNGASFQKYFRAMAQVVDPDPHGRILVPPRLHAFAGFSRRVHFIGSGSYFEIWDRERFDAYVEQIDLESLAEPFNDFVSGLPDPISSDP